MSADPSAFPFRFEGMIIRYGRTVWNVDPLGYQPTDSILEVAAATGAVWEPDGWWTVESQDPDADFYTVTFTSGDAASDDQIGPITAWTDVPAEFRGS